MRSITTYVLQCIWYNNYRHPSFFYFLHLNYFFFISSCKIYFIVHLCIFFFLKFVHRLAFLNCVRNANKEPSVWSFQLSFTRAEFASNDLNFFSSWKWSVRDTGLKMVVWLSRGCIVITWLCGCFSHNRATAVKWLLEEIFQFNRLTTQNNSLQPLIPVACFCAHSSRVVFQLKLIQ